MTAYLLGYTLSQLPIYRYVEKKSLSAATEKALKKTTIRTSITKSIAF